VVLKVLRFLSKFLAIFLNFRPKAFPKFKKKLSLRCENQIHQNKNK
jgi:hypothetical protein